MKAHKILCPTDFSEQSKHALEIASSLARESGGMVLVLHAEQLPTGYREFYYGLTPTVHEENRKALRQVAPTDAEVRFVHKLLPGDAVHSIIQCAKDESVDLIVMGTHGRTGLKRLLLGSVAEAVVRRAPCAVLTVGMPAPVEAEAV